MDRPSDHDELNTGLAEQEHCNFHEVRNAAVLIAHLQASRSKGRAVCEMCSSLPELVPEGLFLTEVIGLFRHTGPVRRFSRREDEDD